MFSRNLNLGFATLVFVAFFAHLPDLGGDTPTRLLFGWVIIFALTGFFGAHALRHDTLTIAPSVAFALIGPPLYFLILGLVGHAMDASYAWTPALVVFTLAALFIAISNAGFTAKTFDLFLSFAIFTQALMLLGSADYPLLAALPGPVAWPSQQVFMHGGYWQVNVMANILACLSLWALWQTARCAKVDGVTLARGLCAFILFPLVIGWSRSFSGLVFLPLGIALLGVVAWRQRELVRPSWFIALSGVTLLSLYAAVFIGVGMEQAPETIGKAQSSSLPTRIGIWLRSFYAFTEAPLFGHGLGLFGEAYNAAALAHSDTQSYRWIDNTRNAHNIVLHNLVEIGLVGTAILLLPFIVFGIGLLRRVPQYWASVAILTPLLGHMMTGYPHRQSAIPVLLVIMIVAHMSVIYGRGPERSVALQRVKKNLRFVALAAFCVPAIGFTVWTAIDYSRASARHMQLANPNYHPNMVKWRLSQPDLRHPFLASHADVQAIFALTSRASYAQDRRTLKRLLPLLASHEARFIRGKAAWSVLVRGYIVVGDFDKARHFLKIADTFNPVFAASLLGDLGRQLRGRDRDKILKAIAPNHHRAE